jgi:deoxyribonuclease-2
MGHTKGVIAFDDNTGFWLVHSVPKYPPYPASRKYGYPATGEKFGQSFLCVSIGTPKTAELIGQQFLYNHPYVYAYNVPAWANGQYPQFSNAAKEQHIKSPPYFHTAQFR